jgi:peptidoglycan/LPS O-acetylase OafA/YrhL
MRASVDRVAGTVDAGRACEGHAGAPFIPSIQGLRGWAALSVMLVHIQLMPMLAGFWPPGVPDWFTLTFATGGRGVELFFVISGYLIPASLHRHGSVARFFYERVMRIVPVFAILHLIVYVAGPWIGYKLFAGMGPAAYAASFTANLLFLAPLLDVPLAQQNAWSLTYEWLFYLWVAAAFCALKGRAHRLLLVPLALVAALAVWRFPSTSYFVLGVAFSSAAPSFRMGRAWGLVAGLAALAAVYYCCEYVSIALGLLPAAVVFALALDRESGLSWLLGRRWLQYLGRISYSLYLVHPFVLFLLIFAARRLGSGAPWSPTAALVFVVLGVGLSVALAGLSYEFVERRLRVRLERLWSRGDRAAPAPEGSLPAARRARLPDPAEAPYRSGPGTALPEGGRGPVSRIAEA